jgi:hypothetical protein
MSESKPSGAPRAVTPPEYRLREVSIDALKQEEPRAAYAYWRRKCAVGRLPHPKDIDATEIPRLLPYVLIVDCLDEDPRDYYYRLEGEAVREAAGYRRMGKRLSELTGILKATYQVAVSCFEAVRTTGEPKAWAYFLDLPGRDFQHFETVVLPLSFDGTRVDRLFMCSGLKTWLASPPGTRQTG